MVHENSRILVFAVCLVGLSCSAKFAPTVPKNDLSNAVSESNPFEGLWHGSWGGGERDGVVFQPLIAEMVIHRDKVEVHGFRNIGHCRGTIRVDEAAKQMWITYSADTNGQTVPTTISFTYEHQGDDLKITDTDGVSISLHRLGTHKTGLANVQIELVQSGGIDDNGDLLLSEFSVLRTDGFNADFLLPTEKRLSTRHATIFLVENAGWKKIASDEARKLIGGSAPVAVAYRHPRHPSAYQAHELWKETGALELDSNEVLQTVSKTIRPGTLLFVVPAEELIPLPVNSTRLEP